METTRGMLLLLRIQTQVKSVWIVKQEENIPALKTIRFKET